jgi:hypothetical protein
MALGPLCSNAMANRFIAARDFETTEIWTHPWQRRGLRRSPGVPGRDPIMCRAILDKQIIYVRDTAADPALFPVVQFQVGRRLSDSGHNHRFL